MDVYSKDQPFTPVRFPHHPESVAREIIPAMHDEIARIEAAYLDVPHCPPEYRRLAELQKGRLLNAIERWEQTVEVVAVHAPYLGND